VLSDENLETLRHIRTTISEFLANAQVSDAALAAVMAQHRDTIAECFAAAFSPPLACEISRATVNSYGQLRNRIAMGKDAIAGQLRTHLLDEEVPPAMRDTLQKLYNDFADGVQASMAPKSTPKRGGASRG
jgi:hypothetical protein